MIQYTKADLLRVAKRVNNNKREYLLVNPLQGKHIPVLPNDALEMMRALGAKIKGQYSGKPLVIGFSETATAIGAAVSAEIDSRCFYLQTTREQDDRVKQWINFSEEHSHATEQKICGDGIDELIANSDYVLLVDDEISTGKTIINTVSAIRAACPSARKKSFVVASIINRVDNSQFADFLKMCVSFVYLLHLEAENYEESIKDIMTSEATPPLHNPDNERKNNVLRLNTALPTPRRGVLIGEYSLACSRITSEIIEILPDLVGKSVLVLGTEEFMYPALLLAQEVYKTQNAKTVKFHATTRSPIGICCEEQYPIKNGIKIHSMYSKDRITYLYDIEPYDIAIVFTDAEPIIPESVAELQQGLKEKRCSEVLFLFGGNHV